MPLGTIIKSLIAVAALAVLGFYTKSFAATPEPKVVPAIAVLDDLAASSQHGP